MSQQGGGGVSHNPFLLGGSAFNKHTFVVCSGPENVFGTLHMSSFKSSDRPEGRA